MNVTDMDTFGDGSRPVDKKGSLTEIKYRKRGPEKNHRPDPIVEKGLLMDMDTEKIAEEEKYDGYYSVFTSEPKMSGQEIRDTCRGLACIPHADKTREALILLASRYFWRKT